MINAGRKKGIISHVPFLRASGVSGVSFCRRRLRSAHRGDRCLAPLLHLAAFTHGLHFVHDVGERLLHRLLQDPALALALRVFGVGQGRQGAVHVLQADGHCKLQPTQTCQINQDPWPLIVLEFNTFLLCTLYF